MRNRRARIFLNVRIGMGPFSTRNTSCTLTGAEKMQNPYLISEYRHLWTDSSHCFLDFPDNEHCLILCMLPSACNIITSLIDKYIILPNFLLSNENGQKYQRGNRRVIYVCTSNCFCTSNRSRLPVSVQWEFVHCDKHM